MLHLSSRGPPRSFGRYRGLHFAAASRLWLDGEGRQLLLARISHRAHELSAPVEEAVPVEDGPACEAASSGERAGRRGAGRAFAHRGEAGRPQGCRWEDEEAVVCQPRLELLLGQSAAQL